MNTPEKGLTRWQRRASRTIATTRILDLEGIQYHHPLRNVDREFISIKTNDWVNVVAVTNKAEIVLVKQFRFGINDFSLEIPGGVIDAGEDPVLAGTRELREETGYAAKSARLMASVHPNPAIQGNQCHFVLVENAELTHDLQWDHDEEIEVDVLPVEQVLVLARSGKITHSLTVAALMHFEGYWRSRGAV